jgi:hypothetical protein
MKIKVIRNVYTVIENSSYFISQEIETTLLNDVTISPINDSVIGVYKGQTSSYYNAALSINNNVCIDFSRENMKYQTKCEEFLKLFTDFVA